MLASVIFLVHNALVFAAMWTLANLCLDAKFSRRTILVVELLSILFYDAVGVVSYYVPWVDALRPIAVAGSFYVLTFLLFKNRFFRKALVATCVYAAVIATEATVYLTFPSLTISVHYRSLSMSSVWWYVVYLCCLAILLYLVYLLLRKKSSDSIDRLSAKQYWFFLFFPLSQYILLAAWFISFGEQPSQVNLLVLTISALICFAADVVWFREMSRIADNARLKAENDLLEKQVAVQRDYYEMLSANYADMSAMRHDIANHIYTIRVLLQDGKAEEAISYAERLEQSRAAKTILSSCKNSVVHSFLCHKLEEFSGKGIDASFDVTLAPKVGIPDTDLIIALGNLLDNAAEACLAAQSHAARLKVSQADGCLHIETENSCSAVSLPKKRRIAYLNRGIGTSILQSLAAQYGGTYTSANEAGINHAVLILKERTL